jgi:hypothetical protein
MRFMQRWSIGQSAMKQGRQNTRSDNVRTRSAAGSTWESGVLYRSSVGP